MATHPPMTCQNCKSPLKLDSSLEDLNPAAFDLLIGATGKSLPDHRNHVSSSRPPYPQERKDLYDHASKTNSGQSPLSKRVIPAPRHGQAHQASPNVQSRHGPRANPDMSFIMLTESQVTPPPMPRVKSSPEDTPKPKSKSKRQSTVDTLDAAADGDRAISYHAERATRLFEIISARSDIDHPICTECTDLLVEGLQRRLSITTKERDAYIDFLRNLSSSIPSEEEVQAAEKSIKEAKDAEAAAFDELLATEKETESAQEEVVALEAEARQLDIEEEEFWRSRNEFALTLAEFQNERDALNMKYDHDARQLEKLQRTNVYNDTFCIGHDGTFGTINGLRLGRLANPSVEWAEINAAWGQTCLLLHTVAEKLGFQFQGYKLRPLGSFSRIDKIEFPQTSPSNSTHTPASAQQPQPPPLPKITTLDLFSSGDIPILTGLWLHRRFDAGMVAFIDCVAQLGVHVEATSRPSHAANTPGAGLKLPYDIKKDKVGDASIKLGFNQDEIWTRACKYTLTCCKFLLAHASNIASSGGGTRR